MTLILENFKNLKNIINLKTLLNILNILTKYNLMNRSHQKIRINVVQKMLQRKQNSNWIHQIQMSYLINICI
jgi:hypothetical protein